MKLFEFDEEETINAMAYASNVDLIHGQATLFAIVCIGDGKRPHFSHGGQLTLSATEAIEVAKGENQSAYEDGMGCRYLPAAVGIHPGALIHLARLVMSNGIEEPGDV